MSIRHHPDDATLVAYGAGSISEGFSLLLAAHLEHCPRCRGRVVETEMLGGSLLETLEDAPLSGGGFDAVWARVCADEEPAAPPSPPPSQPRADGLPAVLAAHLPGGLEGIRWRTLAPGIKQHVLRDVDCGNGTIRLLSIAPGTTIPQHGHGGSELTLVLKGSFMDQIGRFQAGDVADVDVGIHHQPVADTSEPCICLIATDERLRFSDSLSRMLQPFFGI